MVSLTDPGCSETSPAVSGVVLRIGEVRTAGAHDTNNHVSIITCKQSRGRPRGTSLDIVHLQLDYSK